MASHTEWDEANYVAAEIERLVDEANYRYEDCAILFRTRAQGRLFEQVLMHRKLPYTLVGDSQFFERREIKDILAYLRLTHDLFDSGALQRIINRPSRGLGPAALAKLQRGEPELSFTALSDLHRRTDLPERVRDAALAFAELVFGEFYGAAKEKTLPDLIDYVIERSGYLKWIESDPEVKQRMANLAQLRVLAQRYDGVDQALGQFLADIAVLSDSRSMNDADVGITTEAEGITLATVHAVKGLEFPIVFMAGLEEGIFPHAKAVKTPGGIEEEQRLAYVGMTRAMVKLYLSYARTRQVGRDTVEYTPSRFLAVIPKALIERVSASIPAVVTAAPVPEPQSETEGAEDVWADAENAAPAEPLSGLSAMPEPESDLARWLREGQSETLEHEIERAEEMEAWILSERASDDTDLEAEILADEEMLISDELDAELKEAQTALLDHEMYLAEIVYEREMEMESQAQERTKTEPETETEDKSEDFDALLREYADEIAQHAGETAVRSKSPQRTGVEYAIAE